MKKNIIIVEGKNSSIENKYLNEFLLKHSLETKRCNIHNFIDKIDTKKTDLVIFDSSSIDEIDVFLSFPLCMKIESVEIVAANKAPEYLWVSESLGIYSIKSLVEELNIDTIEMSIFWNHVSDKMKEGTKFYTRKNSI